MALGPVSYPSPVSAAITDIISLAEAESEAAAEARSPTDAVVDQLKSMLDEYTQPDRLQQLASFVKRRYDDASSARYAAGVDESIDRADCVIKGERAPGEPCNAGDPDITSNVTATKVHAGRSWMIDILANAKDKPWTITPTPTPELPPAAEEAAVTAVERELLNLGVSPETFSADTADPEVQARVKNIKRLAKQFADELASEAAARVDTRIDDMLTEGGWRAALDAFILDLMSYPLAIMKGPYERPVKVLRWVDGTLSAVATTALVVSRVSPRRFYPAPGATSIQSAPYIIETETVTHNDLLDYAAVDGVDEDSIRAVIEQSRGAGVSTVDAPVDEAESTASILSPGQPLDTYEMLIYTGRVPAALMSDGALDSDPQVEAEIWVIGDVVLRAVSSPNVLGVRPYFATSYRLLPGSLWGQSLPDVLWDTQRVASASLRALVKNLAYSAGPIGEVDVDRLEGETDIDTIEPYRLFTVKADRFAQRPTPALRFTNVPSTAASLLAVHDRFMKQADDISGIPAYVLGNPQVAGAGRTLGGLSLLMGNAAKGIKAVISNVDQNVIEGLIQYAYMLVMTDSDVDEADKVDVKIKARGSSGLLQREIMQARAIEVLQLLTPYVQMQIVPPEALIQMLRDVLSGLGYDPDKILPDLVRQGQLQSIASGVTPPVAGISVPAPGTPMPSLDQRSALPPDPAAAERLPAQPD